MSINDTRNIQHSQTREGVQEQKEAMTRDHSDLDFIAITISFSDGLIDFKAHRVIPV